MGAQERPQGVRTRPHPSQHLRGIQLFSLTIFSLTNNCPRPAPRGSSRPPSEFPLGGVAGFRSHRRVHGLRRESGSLCRPQTIRGSRLSRTPASLHLRALHLRFVAPPASCFPGINIGLPLLSQARGCDPDSVHSSKRVILLSRRRLRVRSLRADAGIEARPWSIMATRVEGLHGGPASDPAER
jgi:hypothetical protein